MTDMPLSPPRRQDWPTLSIDADQYLHFLEECDWTEDQKRAFIEALWQIIVGFIDLDFPLLLPAKADAPLKTLDEDSPSVLALDTNSNMTERQDGEARA
jgi:hypothetical protein